MIRLSRAQAEALGIELAPLRKPTHARRLAAWAWRAPLNAQEGSPGPWRLSWVGLHPPTLNELTRGRLRARIKLGKAWRSETLGQCLKSGVRPATGKRRVSIHIILGPRQTGPDPDAFFKAVGDACVKVGALKTDTRHGVEWGSVTYSRAEIKGTILRIEEL